MLELANEKLQAAADWEALNRGGDEEYDRATQKATEELLELEAQGPNEVEEADRLA